MLEFDIENALVIKHELEEFLVKIEGDWKSVIVQWERLAEYWSDQQYSEFEPFFEILSIRYERLLEEIAQYNLFLQNNMNEVEKLPEPKYAELRDSKRNRYGSGEFTRIRIAQLPNDLQGVYYIHAPDIYAFEDSEITYYIGKSDSSIKDRLFSHLEKSSNQNFQQVVALGQPLLFYWHESPIPAYEEALVIRRLKSKGMLMGQRREIKVLIEKLDFD